MLDLAIAGSTTALVGRAYGHHAAVRCAAGLGAALAAQRAFLRVARARAGPERPSPADLLTYLDFQRSDRA